MSDSESTTWRSLASPTLLRWLAVIGGVMLIVGTTANALLTLTDLSGFARAFAAQFYRLFYAGDEFTVWAWFTAALMAAVGVTLALIALLLRRTDAQAGSPYAILAAVALALSIDETAQFHEGLTPLPRILGLGELPTYEWLVVGIPLAILGGVGVLVVARRIDARLRTGLIVGGALFLFGAIVLEGLGGLLARSVEGSAEGSAAAELGVQLLLAVEEGFELAGVLLALAAVLAMVEWRGVGGEVSVRVRAGSASRVKAEAASRGGSAAANVES